MKENYAIFNKTGLELYGKVKNLPIIDYHCHLSAEEIYNDKQYESITQMWLYGDHYKWRQMRTYGIDEKYITGDSSDYEKFVKYIEMLTYAIGSPLYVWSKLELSNYFDVEEDINVDNAKIIYEKCNAAIKAKHLCPSTIMKMSRVESICTIEDVYSDVKYHKLMQGKTGTKILPAIRFDKAINILDGSFNSYMDKLGKATGIEIKKLDDLTCAIDSQIQAFADVGCVSADIAFEGLNYDEISSVEANAIFIDALGGNVHDADKFLCFMLRYILPRCYEKGFALQIHIGAMRNNNAKMFAKLGADTGYDSVSDAKYLSGLKSLLSSLDYVGKTIIFNINPADNQQISTLVGCFVGDGVKGKVQMGAAWWFNDNVKGINEQFEVLCATSLLSTFVGMLTDSRSILSYPRHDYFRRLLCNFVGDQAERGLFTDNEKILTKLVSDVSYFNAKRYFFGE